jgi:predicted RNA-binding protein YlxR (DUF448 family)
MAAPRRTCIGCRGVDDRSRLVRFVRDGRGILTVDARGAAPGRGAWLHPRRECLAAALGGERFAKALRARVALLPHDQSGDPPGDPTKRLWELMNGAD